MTWFKNLPDEENDKKDTEKESDFIDDIFNEEPLNIEQEEAKLIHLAGFLFEKVASITLLIVNKVSAINMRLIVLLNVCVIMVKAAFAAESIGLKKVYDYMLYISNPLITYIMVDNNNKWFQKYVEDYAKLDNNLDYYCEYLAKSKKLIDDLRSKIKNGDDVLSDQKIIDDLKALEVDDTEGFIKTYINHNKKK